MSEMSNINRTLVPQSLGCRLSTCPDPLASSGAGGDSRDTKLLAKIGLGLTRNILRVGTSQKTVPKTHTLSPECSWGLSTNPAGDVHIAGQAANSELDTG